MACQQQALIFVFFSTTVRDKSTAVKNLFDITKFRLDETQIHDLSVDNDQGCSTAVVKCHSVFQAEELVICINKSKYVKASLSNSCTKAPSMKTRAKRQSMVKYRVQPAHGNVTKVAPSINRSRTVMPSTAKNAPYIVLVSLGLLFSKEEEALEFIQVQTGFKLKLDQLKLDFVDNSTRATTRVFIECETKLKADQLIIECNSSSWRSSIVATMLDMPDWFNELQAKALERIAAHDKKIEEVAAKLQDIDASLKSTKQNKNWKHLDEYERIKGITKPLKDKKEELLLQRCEFVMQFETLKSKVTSKNVCKSDLDTIKMMFERELERFNSALPMYSRKSEITETVRKNQVCIILGETGSGKSTQILQYLYDAGLANNGTIVCTQPRKVAAISLAGRVSQEMCCQVGQLVGYRVGMQAQQNVRTTRLLYVTDHVLLNDCLKDPLFKDYSCIVIDEAHERSIYSDLLLGFVKRALFQRSDLHVIIMSATIDCELFVSYFSNCCDSAVDQPQSSPPVLRISGRAYPVVVEYKDIVMEDYVTEAVETASILHRMEPPGDILVFLTSPIETEQACKKMHVHMKNAGDVILLELHGRLQMEDQQKIFEATPKGKRKIVFATNSAETSITIPGIKYVVDTGKVREVNYDPKRNFSELAIQWVTQSSAEQRKGRAGRTDCGKCIRLYSKEQYDAMRTNSVPEILRVHLGQALLKLMNLGVVDATKFDFVQSPDKDAILGAQTVLRELDACDDNGITELGKKLAKLSLEPRLGKVTIKGIEEGIPFESIIMAAVSTVGGSIFFRAGSDEQKRLADRKKTRFCDEWGDIVTLVNVYREWDSLPPKEQNRWCQENSINAKSMRTAKSTVNEIRLTLKHELKMTVPQRFNDDATANEKMAKIIFECYSSNLSRYCGHINEGYCMATSPDMVFHVHPSSAFNYVEDWPQWVVHEKILTTSRTFMLNVTFVKNSWVDEKKLNFPADLLLKATVEAHPIIYVGKTFIGRLLRDKAQLKKKLEFDMRLTDVNVAKAVIDVVLSPDCIGGSITLYSNRLIRKSAADIMHIELLNTKVTLLNDVIEDPLFVHSSIRMVLEHGAQIRSIIMPHESRQVKICNVKVDGEDVADNFIINALSQFEGIESVRKDDRFKDCWGYVRFNLPEQAAAVVDSFKNNPPQKFEVKLFANSRKQERPLENSDFTVRVVAQRRPLTGFGFVMFDEDGMASQVASHVENFVVKGKTSDASISLQINKKDVQQCYIPHVPLWADENMIMTSLTEKFVNLCIKKVILPRKKEPSQAESNELLNAFQTDLSNTLLSYMFTAEDFTLNLQQLKNTKDFYMVAYLKFSDSGKAHRATKILNETKFRQCPLDAILDLNFSVVIPKNIEKFLMPYFEKEIAGLQAEAVEKLDIKIQERKQFKLVIVSTSCLSDLILTKRKLSTLLKGHKVQLSGPQISYLKLALGRKLLDSFERDMCTTIILDFRMNIAFIYGSQDNVLETERRLTKELCIVANQLKKDVSLGHSKYPKGMMKAVINRYGADLEKLRDACGAASLDLFIRHSRLQFLGSTEAYAVLVQLLDDVASDLPGERNIDQDRIPECSLCLTDVEKDTYYVMEYCQHVYCKDCVNSLFENAIRNNSIPIKCAADKCDMDVVIQDLKNVYNRNLQPIYDAALRSFMQHQTEKYKYCITPNCQMIYRRTADNVEGEIFNCTECQTSVCTSCNVAYHFGSTCALNRHLKDDDGSLKLWLEKDKIRRSTCPKCGVGIEKYEGCNHVTCASCHAHICWTCKKTFGSDNECYQHMASCGGMGL